MDADTGHAAVEHQPARDLEAAEIPGALPRAQLDRHRQPAPPRRRASDRDRPRRLGEERRPGAGLAHFRDRAAHVDVDQIRASGGHPLGRGRHHVRIVAEQLHRHRVLLGVDPQELAAGTLVAVVHREARHHLRHDQACPVALGLEANEPVADSGQRREHHAVWNRHPPEAPGIRKGSGHRVSWYESGDEPV